MVGPVRRPTAGIGQREGSGGGGAAGSPGPPCSSFCAGAVPRPWRSLLAGCSPHPVPLQDPARVRGEHRGGRALAGPESPARGGGGRGRARGKGGRRGLRAYAAERRNSAPAKPRKRASPWCDLWRARRSPQR